MPKNEVFAKNTLGHLSVSRRIALMVGGILMLGSNVLSDGAVPHRPLMMVMGACVFSLALILGSKHKG